MSIIQDYSNLTNTYFTELELRDERNGCYKYQFHFPSGARITSLDVSNDTVRGEFEAHLHVPFILDTSIGCRRASPTTHYIPEVNRIIYSGNKTIVLWKDGTKTIVGCSEGEDYDEFDGFTAALAKKIYGSTCAVKREIMNKSTKQEKK